MALRGLVSVSLLYSQWGCDMTIRLTGETQALASVSGPIEVRPNLESPSQAVLDVHIRPLASLPGTDAKYLGNVLKTVFTPALFLTQHPRTLVQIVGQALCGSDSGSGTGSVGKNWNASLTASLINATSAAFINAGSVPMRGVVCAVAVGRLVSEKKPSSCTLVLDPSEAELAALAGGGCFAFFLSSTLSVSPSESEPPAASLLWRNYAASNGSFDEAELELAQQLAERGAQRIWHIMKTSLDPSAQIKAEVRLDQGSKNAEETEIDDDRMEI